MSVIHKNLFIVMNFFHDVLQGRSTRPLSANSARQSRYMITDHDHPKVGCSCMCMYMCINYYCIHVYPFDI